MSEQAHTVPSRRRYLVIFASQLVLVAVAVAVSRLGVGARTAGAAVMVASAVNASVVATGLMGVRQGGWFITALLLVTLIAAAGLIGWPVWDVYERARAY